MDKLLLVDGRMLLCLCNMYLGIWVFFWDKHPLYGTVFLMKKKIPD